MDQEENGGPVLRSALRSRNTAANKNGGGSGKAGENGRLSPKDNNNANNGKATPLIPTPPDFDEAEVEKLCARKMRVFENELGFRHWLAVVVLVSAIYAVVVWQDSRMPPVVPANQHQNFSEERARVILQKLTDLGPRISGSEALEKHAFALITGKIAELTAVVDKNGVNRLEMDVQRPIGCFDLKFLSAFTACYHKPTNIVARLGPRPGPTDHSLLINCHFDTLPDTPGATDDAVSCAIMLEVMEVLAHSSTPLENDIVLLFNGAEENFLQASHGFISNHPWRHQIRAFINLEGCGAGGREILFQAGPGESWLLKTYLDNAPHPHASVIAQEVFQAGVVPSDTDFRIFRDYGRISGLDIAYVRNGWVYHTEFDRPELIHRGAIQRSGDNILAVSRAIIRSPYLLQPANFAEGNKWVFYDMIGLFTVFYEVRTGTIINYTMVALTFLLVGRRIKHGLYTPWDLLRALGHHAVVLAAMAAVGAGMVAALTQLGLTMTWYSMPELVFPIYMLPMLSAAFWVHLRFAERKRGMSAEAFHYDLTLILFALLLLVLTALDVASAFLVLCHLLFPLLRDPAIFVCGKLGVVREVTPRTIFWFQAVIFTPMIVYVTSAILFTFEFFVPLMGRFGNTLNPEFVMATLSLVVTNTLILFCNNLIYISRRLHFLHRTLLAWTVLALLVVFTTRIGDPYKYSEEAPRVRRIIALHTKRTVFEFGETVSSKAPEYAIFVQSMDFRSTADLPEHTFLQASDRPNCSHTLDQYCQLPYYVAVHELLPPDQALWVPIPAEPFLPRPLSVQLLAREKLSESETNITLAIHGGADKMSLHVTPLNGFKFKRWSLTAFDSAQFNKRSTYFAFMTYGYEAPPNRTMWIVLEKKGQSENSSDDTGKLPALEFAVATHFAHGPHQDSETLGQLRQLIRKRRETPHIAVGYWRWAMTMIGSVAEIVVHKF